uniref:Uncharacterized protein n=1 Tax=Meloidogyne incognita TaxID=6306 RepID=A0A914KUD8_MELIC
MISKFRKFFDYDHCQKQCNKLLSSKASMKQNHWREFWLQTKMLWISNRIDSDVCDNLPSDQHCLHKHRNHIEKSCSKDQRRVAKMRMIGFQLEQIKNEYMRLNGIKQFNKLRNFIEQDICRLLNTQISCIISSGQNLCSDQERKRKILKLDFSFIREYFLSTLLPSGRVIDKYKTRSFTMIPLELDQLLPEVLLDRCQKSNFYKNVDGDRLQRALIDENVYGEEGEEVTIGPNIRRLFSSEEDLEDMPPNFFYSTARLTNDFNSRYSVQWGDQNNIVRTINNKVTVPNVLTNDQVPIVDGQEEFHDILNNKHENNIDLGKNVKEQINNNIEEYEEEWVYEDDSSEPFDDDEEFKTEEVPNIPTTPTSSVEALIDGIEGVRQENHKSDPILQTNHNNEGENRQRYFSTTNDFISDKSNGEASSQPMLQDTHIYFSKILEFDEDHEIEYRNKWPNEVKSTFDVVQTNVDSIENIQEPILKNSELPVKLNGEQNHEANDEKNHHYENNSPFVILPADISEYYANEIPLKKEHLVLRKHLIKDGKNQRISTNDQRQKILVSTEPVPTKGSETLLVLLGVYLAFFALAAFFLFCLVLAWLERRSRRHTSYLTDHEIKENKSLFLYMNPNKGTMKYIA